MLDMEVLLPSAQHGDMGSCLPFFCPGFPSAPQTFTLSPALQHPWEIRAVPRTGDSSAFLPAEGWGPSRLSHLESPLRENSHPRGGAERGVGQRFPLYMRPQGPRQLPELHVCGGVRDLQLAEEWQPPAVATLLLGVSSWTIPQECRAAASPLGPI